MFKRILFPTKFDEFSLPILNSILCLKSAGLEEVILLHVVDLEKLYSTLEWGNAINLDGIKEQSVGRLNSYIECLGSEGITARPVVAEGNVVPEIMKTAARLEASLIGAGRQKRNVLGELFIGSTTDRIIRRSHIPVLVSKYHALTEIGGEVIERFCLNMFRKVLLPVDWSPWTERAKEYLPFLQQVGASEVIILHVADGLAIEAKYMTEKTQETIREGTAKLETLKQELQASGFHAEAHLLEGGRAYQEINRMATKEDVSMIVMGSHGKGFPVETIWGSVSQRVVEYSEKPVLVVK